MFMGVLGLQRRLEFCCGTLLVPLDIIPYGAREKLKATLMSVGKSHDYQCKSAWPYHVLYIQLCFCSFLNAASTLQ